MKFSFAVEHFSARKLKIIIKCNSWPQLIGDEFLSQAENYAFTLKWSMEIYS